MSKLRNTTFGFVLGVVSTLAVTTAMSDARATSKFGRAEFHRAIDDVLDRYVDPVDEPEVLARGLKHLVAGLDPHSHYLTAAERKALKERSRGGVAGLAVAMKHGDGPQQRWLEVVAVEPSSPAAKAGLQPGDHILAVDDKDVAELMSQVEAEASLVGSVGQTIAMSVQRVRDPAPRRVTLTLDRQRVDVVAHELLTEHDATFGYVRIRAFKAGTGDRVKDALASLRRAAGKRGLQGIILDLRGNPGGHVDEALVVADLFVASGVLTRTRGRGGRVLREERAHKQGTDTATPLAVLQDRHSASASELLAVALQEHGRAFVVGERSYGKGSVQEVTGLSDGSVLSLTIARYFSPNDRGIDGVGVSPDIHLASAAPTAKGDPALEAALTRFTAP